ncbi:hypothetical protein D3C71_1470800 [compost metagenome]
MHRFDGFCEQFTESIRDRLGTGILNQVGFTSLGDQRQGDGVDRFKASVSARPAGGFHIQIAAHPFQRRAAAHQRAPGVVHLFAVAVFNTQLHQLILSNNQRIQLAIDFLLDGARREKQIGNNRTDNPDDNLTATLKSKLRRKQGFTLNGDHNDQRGITG